MGQLVLYWDGGSFQVDNQSTTPRVLSKIIKLHLKKRLLKRFTFFTLSLPLSRNVISVGNLQRRSLQMSWIAKNLVLMIMVTTIIFTILSVGVYLQYRSEEESLSRPDFMTTEVEDLQSADEEESKGEIRQLVTTSKRPH